MCYILYTMKSHLHAVIGTCLAFTFSLFFSCATAPTTTASGLSAEAQVLIREAVFEVVVKKPLEDSLKYDKPLSWDNVPFAIRSDKYFSIGTAFAVSSTDLITAFHVVELGRVSRIFKEFYIRDKKGQVFEIENVTQGSKERDFLKFTVKNKTFERFFELKKDFETGSMVYSVGNALGEGIVVRNGLILGTIPEEEAGKWSRLKSSADGNPGNSGGPLITPEGKVVAVVTALKDNILYSLPIEALLEVPTSTLEYRQKSTYGHLLLSNNITRTFETSLTLPAPYQDISKAIGDRYTKAYTQYMEELFSEAPAYLDGPNNMYVLDTVIGHSFPEVNYVNKDDNQWRTTYLKVDTFALPEDGVVAQAKVSEFSFLKVKLPRGVQLSPMLANPENLMDLILKGLSMERSLGSQKYRILSFGGPQSVSEYKDSLGRVWLMGRWTIEFEDRTLLASILPLPNGPAVVMTYQPSSQADIYEWDLKAICDRVQTAYMGEFPEWKNFLAMKKWIPPFLSDLKFQWAEDINQVSVETSSFSLVAGADVFSWTTTSSLVLSPAHYNQDGKRVYDIRKVLLQRDLLGKDFAILYKNIKPDTALGAKSAEVWDAILKEKTPFDNRPGISTKDQNGSMGVILSQAVPSTSMKYSLYLTTDEAGTEEALSLRFQSLKSGVSLK